MERQVNGKGHAGQKDGSGLTVFEDLFPVLVQNLAAAGAKDAEIQDATEWFKKVSQYNVPFGKKNRGLAVVQSYQCLVPQPKEEELLTARVLGWCIEWLQAFFLVADDIMDQSHTRRGKPCWYKNPGVGLEAINDSFFLESAIYVLLKKYCKGKPYYLPLLELFHETTLQTVTGQCLDMLTSAPEQGLQAYSRPRHKAIVKWKTAFYSFYLPVACAMYMAGIEDEELHSRAKHILLQMGEYFQIQDDFLDCYGDPNVTGKVGTDIEDNKCSWLVVEALHKATPQQREVLQENYGRGDAACVAAVKMLYAELGLEQAYYDYENQSYVQIQQLIEELGEQLPQQMFTSFVDKIYKRKK